MKIRRKIFMLLVIGLCASVAFLPGSATAGTSEQEDEEQPESPEEMVKSNTEKVLSIFRDPELAGEGHRKERRKKVREAVQDVFDWAAISRSAVGRKWWDFSDEQKEQFTEAFRQLLENSYLKRIEENTDAKIDYLGAEEDDGDWEVDIKAVASNGREVPISYKLYSLNAEERQKKDAQYPWLIYDVDIEGVSLVSNYRSQFRDILMNRSIDELIEQIRKKVESQKE